MIRINSYSEFKKLLEDYHYYDSKSKKGDACRLYAQVPGRANGVYDMGKSPTTSSIYILDEYREMLENGLFPFYDLGALTFVPMNQVTLYGVAFSRADEAAFLASRQ